MKRIVADGERGILWEEKGKWERKGPPCHALCAGCGRVYCAGEKRCICLEAESGEALFDFPLPGGVCALEMLGEKVCALSSDADCLNAFCAHTGTLLFSAPAGVYPRDLCISPCGKFLAAAGGAAGEILLFDDTLSCIQKRRVPGAACAVCFLPRGMAALCAVGEEELSSQLITFSPRGAAKEIYSFPDAPCALCMLSNGALLAGCHGEVALLRTDGRILYRRPCAYPARIRPNGRNALICDGWEGCVTDLQGRIFCQGSDPKDVAERGKQFGIGE